MQWKPFPPLSNGTPMKPLKEGTSKFLCRNSKSSLLESADLNLHSLASYYMLCARPNVHTNICVTLMSLKLHSPSPKIITGASSQEILRYDRDLRFSRHLCQVGENDWDFVSRQRKNYPNFKAYWSLILHLTGAQGT